MDNITIPSRPPLKNQSQYTLTPNSKSLPPIPVVDPSVPYIVDDVVGPNTLAGLTDVTIVPNAPKGGYVLTYVDKLGAWTPQPIPILRKVYISISITGPMNSNEVLMQYAIPEAVTIPAGGAYGSFAISANPASGYVTATINKNKVQVGTITWGPNSYSGAINLPSKLYLQAGDVLQLIAPLSPDSTLANIGVTFACIRGG